MKPVFKKTLLAMLVAGMPLTASAEQNAAAEQAAQPAQSAAPQAVEPAPAPAKAAPVQADAEVDEAVADAAVPEVIDPTIELMDQINDWKMGAGEGLARKADRGQLFLGEGFATVKVTPQSADWVDQRIMAYKAALMDAQAQYIEFEGISTRADTVSRFFDDKTQMPSFTPEELSNTSKMQELLDKAVAVVGGKLDQELVELGIDPAEFKAAPSEKRALMFEDSISEQVSTKARATLTGVIPVKTFEANDAQGQHSVAVVIAASARMRDFVQEVTTRKGDIAPNPARAGGPTLREIFADKTALINEFGIRKMYDENGYPVLVSFGQSGTGYEGTDTRRKMSARKGAFKFAKSAAYANFAYLLNASGVAKSDTSVSSTETREGVARMESGGVVESEESRLALVKKINDEIAARGSISDLAGTRQLMRWTAKHPVYGNEVNGVVYVWHPVGEQQARELRNYTPRTNAKTAAQPVREMHKTQANRVQSRDLMSADDF